MNNFIKLITCPITNKIFNIPVIASDSCVYEAEEAIKIINSKIESPITNKILTEDIYKIVSLKNIITKLIETHEKYKELVYQPTYDINKTYYFSKEDIIKIFTERLDYNLLLNYDDFKFKDLDKYSFKDFLRVADSKVIIHVFDHCDDLEYSWDNSWKVINYVCKLCKNNDVIRHIITKNIDLDCPCSNGWSPIHHVALFHDGLTTRLLVAKGVNLLSELISQDTALEIILNKQNEETILFSLNFVNTLSDLMLAKLIVSLDENNKLEEEEKETIKYALVSKIV